MGGWYARTKRNILKIDLTAATLLPFCSRHMKLSVWSLHRRAEDIVRCGGAAFVWARFHVLPQWSEVNELQAPRPLRRSGRPLIDDPLRLCLRARQGDSTALDSTVRAPSTGRNGWARDAPSWARDGWTGGSCSGGVGQSFPAFGPPRAQRGGHCELSARVHTHRIRDDIRGPGQVETSEGPSRFARPRHFTPVERSRRERIALYREALRRLRSRDHELIVARSKWPQLRTSCPLHWAALVRRCTSGCPQGAPPPRRGSPGPNLPPS